MNVKERKTQHSATLFFLYRAVDIDTGWIKDARKKKMVIIILMWWIKGLMRRISEVSKVQRQLSSC